MNGPAEQIAIREATMTFTEAVITILETASTPLTPQEIRDVLKEKFPAFYGTESQHRNVEKGYYNSLNHALQAQIYSLIRRNDQFLCDDTVKPLKVSFIPTPTPGEDGDELPSVDSLESNIGNIYVLGTNTFTREGKEIVKIGLTSDDISHRLKQLYSTSVPYRFRVIEVFNVTGFTDLERALHVLLAPYRLNPVREFFTEDAVPFVDQIVALHNTIRVAAEPAAI